MNNPIKKDAYKFFRFFFIFLSIIFVLKNVLRIVKPEDTNAKSFFPKIIFVNKSDTKKIILNNFSYYESVKMCGYGFSPCTHYLKQKLKSKKYFNYKVIINN
jgi:hypothetical protein